MQNESAVLVFRTDVRTRRQAFRICRTLERSAFIRRATLDLEDCDHVLRIETQGNPGGELLQILGGLGVLIEVLD